MPEEIRHLRTEDRKIIARLKKDQKPQTEIARTIGFSQSAISKELARNSGKRGYRPKQAQAKAPERKNSKRARGSVITEDLAGQIIVRLEAKHSPEQISGALALTGQRVSTSTIYNHICQDKRSGGQLHLNLRINGRRRYRSRNKASRAKDPQPTRYFGAPKRGGAANTTRGFTRKRSLTAWTEARSQTAASDRSLPACRSRVARRHLP